MMRRMLRAGGASMVYQFMSEDDIGAILRHPQVAIASDSGLNVMGQGVPHPRGYGNNARALGALCARAQDRQPRRSGAQDDVAPGGPIRVRRSRPPRGRAEPPTSSSSMLRAWPIAPPTSGPTNIRTVSRGRSSTGSSWCGAASTRRRGPATCWALARPVTFADKPWLPDRGLSRMSRRGQSPPKQVARLRARSPATLSDCRPAQPRRMADDCRRAHPARRRSRTPVSPSDLLTFCVADFITSG